MGELPLPLDTLLTSDAVIARVGPTVVTVREFMLTSLFGPAFVKRQPESRQRTLDYMINEKLLALGASNNSGDPRVGKNLAALEGDMATEELYRDDVLRHVKLSDGEIAEGVNQLRTSITLRWLYRKQKDKAVAAVRELRSGRSFDALYRQEISGSGVTNDDRRMSGPLFRIRLRNAPMAMLAARLPVGRPSDPVQGPDGFYIMQVDSLSRDVLTTESADARERDDVRKALTKLKADSLSDLYVRQRMLEANPEIQRPAFDVLRAYLGSRVLSDERFAGFGLTAHLDAGDTSYRAIDRFASRTLVKLRKGRIAIGDFLEWYRLRETGVTFRSDSPEGFFLSVEDVVWRMVRDRLLVAAALGRGLQQRPGVAVQKRWWKEKLLYQVAMDSIKRTIGWTDSTLQEYYAAHPRSFRDSTGTVRPFAEVKDDVLREWYDLEVKARVLRALHRLKSTYAVAVDEKVLNSIPMDAENDPRAIEVYTVKKGGTFPHPAFPTIDRSWQTWQ
jgi:hypothetical protein